MPVWNGCATALAAFGAAINARIFVEALVSSMKTRQAGSSSDRASNQALRRAATSGLSCSAACAVFFERHGVAIEEAPHRARRERGPMLPAQHLGNLAQRDVGLVSMASRMMLR